MDNKIAPAFVLVRPQMGENIGAVARAMGNFGLHDLRLVAPRDGWPNNAAQATASGALDSLIVPAVFETMHDALHDIHHVYGTTARDRDMAKAVITPDEAAHACLDRVASQNPEAPFRVAFVFGPERTGLENDQAALCHTLIRVPTSPAFASLNLGQCALLMAYEIARHFNTTPSDNDRQLKRAEHVPATMESFYGFWQRFEKALDEAGFFTEDNLRPKVTRNIQTMLLRGELSEHELKTYHGILSALLKSQDR